MVDFIILILLILLVVSIVRRVRRRGEMKRTRGTELEHVGTKPPTLKIVALGLSGAGKTVYLSSMFHSLNFRDDRRSYFLESSPEQRVALSKIYSTLADTLQPWPPGTRIAETREYIFDCIAFDEINGKQHVLSINYLDYAGELLETEQELGSIALQNLSAHINGAHALLCVIDGYRVLQLLKNETAGRNYFQFSMQTMIGMMQGANCPIHLVISKWDIVRDFGEPAYADEQLRLELVIEALMAFDHIRSLTYRSGTHQKITRVIPVSAIGANFARIDPDGAMVKQRDGQMRPFNVDVPLCAVVPDLFKQVESSLKDPSRKVISVVASILGGPAGIVVRAILFVALGREVGGIGNEAVMMFTDWLTQEKRTAKKGSRASAQASALADFEKAVFRLEALFPNSQLSRK